MDALEVLEAKWREDPWGLAMLYNVKNRPHDIRVRLYRLHEARMPADPDSQLYAENFPFFDALPPGKVRSEAFNAIDPMY